MRSRRRGAELEGAILDAAWAELHDVGYANLTIEAVAARAATSKSVIYRRWPSRAALIMAAWSRYVPAERGWPDTGDLRGDLIELFTLIAKRVDSMMSETIAGVLGEAIRHPEIVALLRARLSASPMASPIRAIVDRAVERGQLPPVELPPRASRVPLDLIRNEAMICGSPVDAETISELVDDVYLPLLRGLAADREPTATKVSTDSS